MHKPFNKELAELINRHSRENDSDTPDFILADFLSSCFDAYAVAVRAREEWYGRKPVMVNNIAEPGRSPLEIRASALEAALRLQAGATSSPEVVLKTAQMFEDYMEGGGVAFTPMPAPPGEDPTYVEPTPSPSDYAPGKTANCPPDDEIPL